MSARRVPAERLRGSVYLGLAGALFAASGAMIGGYVLTGGPSQPAARAVVQGPASPDGALAASVTKALDGTVTIKAGGQARTLRWS